MVAFATVEIEYVWDEAKLTVVVPDIGPGVAGTGVTGLTVVELVALQPFASVTVTV